MQRRNQRPTRKIVAKIKAEVMEKAFEEVVEMCEREGVEMDRDLKQLEQTFRDNSFTVVLKRGETNGKEKETRG